MNEFIIAIDPHVDHCDFVAFENKDLTAATTYPTEAVLEGIAALHPFWKNKLILEDGWVGRNKQQSIDHAILIGRIYQSHSIPGFEVILAPSWGPDCWQKKILGRGNKIPSREETAKLAVIRAKADHPGRDWDEHTASAYCLVMWYFDFYKDK